MIVYVATPYSHNAAAVEQRRYEQSCLARDWFIRQGDVVFAPIAASHLAALSGAEPPQGWYEWDIEFLESIKPDQLTVAVIQMPGWESSTGVRLEMDWADKHGVAVKFYHFDADTDDLVFDSEATRFHAVTHRNVEEQG